MFNNIIETCNKFNIAFGHRNNPSDEDINVLENLNLNLAKSIIQDMDEHNAKKYSQNYSCKYWVSLN